MQAAFSQRKPRPYGVRPKKMRGAVRAHKSGDAFGCDLGALSNASLYSGYISFVDRGTMEKGH